MTVVELGPVSSAVVRMMNNKSAKKVRPLFIREPRRAPQAAAKPITTRPLNDNEAKERDALHSLRSAFAADEDV